MMLGTLGCSWMRGADTHIATCKCRAVLANRSFATMTKSCIVVEIHLRMSMFLESSVKCSVNRYITFNSTVTPHGARQ